MPFIGPTNCNSEGEVIFHPDKAVLFKRFIWIVMGLIMIVLLGTKGWEYFLAFSIVGFSGYFKLILRLLHLKDKVVLSATHATFRSRSKIVQIEMSGIDRIEIRYAPNRNSITPYFIFHGSGPEQRMELFEDFFLEKTPTIVETMCSLYPEKRFEIYWENILKQDDKMIFQPGNKAGN